MALLAVAPRATGHIEPAVDANNRWIKLTPMGNQVRLVYTVYMGEIPGSRARKRLDSDRDGNLSEAETAVFAEEMAAAVQTKLEVTIDGQRVPVVWSLTDVGLGTPVVAAGAFSVDLIANLCITRPELATHELIIFDRYRVPRPGETEVKIEESPGVHIESSTFGGKGQSMLEMKWSVVPSPFETDGVHVRFTVDPKIADTSMRVECSGISSVSANATDESAGSGGNKVALLILIPVAILLLAAIGLVIVRRTKSC